MTASYDWRKTIQYGLLAGIITLVTAAIGMVEAFDERDLIVGFLTLGQVLLFGAPFIVGYLVVANQDHPAPVPALLSGLVAGLLTGIPLALLVLLATYWTSIRDYFVNISPRLIEILTFGRDPLLGSMLLILAMGGLGLLGAAVRLIPQQFRRPLLTATAITLGIALFSDVPLNIANELLPRSIVRQLLGTKGIMPVTALAIFVISLIMTFFWQSDGRRAAATTRAAKRTPQERTRNERILRLVLLGVLLVLPWVLGIFLTNVVDQVGIFIMMALGLNIVVGFAGLLDLGYVAFFAIGAYVTGVLTSTGDLGFGWSFWAALPVAIVSATLAGIVLGIPVLRLRGDYLAIVTLGFGEIIRVLVRSDLLKGVIGGAQGILNIQRPTVGDFVFISPQHFYYLILIGCLIAWYVSARLRDGRLGRRWMAMREDEDVAEAMGINLTTTKLLAFAMGATFAGMAGSIFAARLGSVFPNSFELLISINVLAIVIVGGLGSLPGVVLGAFMLVGLPELLREFEEYRLLMYGILLIVMMLVRPEGLWPSAITQRELHADDELAALEYDTVEEANPLV
jgi:branched-chain amino acid transport system permease protein